MSTGTESNQPTSAASADSSSAQQSSASDAQPQTASAGSTESAKEAEKPSKEVAERLLAEGGKLAALKKREEAVDKFADALDVMRELVSELDPAMAPFLLSYGKALYELALSQSGVMGKEEVQKGTQGQLDAQDEGASSTLVESADPEIIAAAEAEAEAAAANEGDADSAEEDGEEQGEEEQAPEEDDAPEDDFNAAWEVLDVARTIYAKVVEEKKEKQEEYQEDDMRLADCYLFLGDVSCETENFEQAVSDYTSALTIQKAHLPSGSRAVASSYFQIGSVLEFLSGRRADALAHVQHAIEGFRARESQLVAAASASSDAGLIPELAKLSAKEREAELKDTREFIGDLEAKLEELKVAPEQEDLVTQGIKHLIGGGQAEAAFASAFGDAPIASTSSAGAAGSAEAAPVNTLMVKKKKKPAAPAPAPAAESANGDGNGIAEQVKEAAQSAAAAVGQASEAAVESVKRTAEDLAQGAEEASDSVKKARME